MKYELFVKDELGWINLIQEERNTKDELILYVDFHPKRLIISRAGSRGGDEPDTEGITFMKGEETLYAEGHQYGEVFVHTEVETDVFIEVNKYSTIMVFIKKIDYKNSRTVYPVE